MEKKLPRIERGTTKIIVPHGKGEKVFDGRSEGPGDYQTVGGGLLARNLEVPIGDYMASLVHVAYCNDFVGEEPEFKEIRNIRRTRGLWVFNRNLWTSNGVYVVQDLKAVGTSQALNQNELEKMLKSGKEIDGIRFSKDGKIRFAPKRTYELREHIPDSLAKDGFIIASYGFEGAEKLGEVTFKVGHKSRTRGIDIQENQNPIQKVSALCGPWNSLDVFGNCHNNTRDGYAFGVLK